MHTYANARKLTSVISRVVCLSLSCLYSALRTRADEAGRSLWQISQSDLKNHVSCVTEVGPSHFDSKCAFLPRIRGYYYSPYVLCAHWDCSRVFHSLWLLATESWVPIALGWIMLVFISRSAQVPRFPCFQRRGIFSVEFLDAFHLDCFSKLVIHTRGEGRKSPLNHPEYHNKWTESPSTVGTF